jgi:hypothetical protein
MIGIQVGLENGDLGKLEIYAAKGRPTTYTARPALAAATSVVSDPRWITSG